MSAAEASSGLKHLVGNDAAVADPLGRAVMTYVDTHRPLIEHMLVHAIELRLAMFVAPGTLVARAFAATGAPVDPKIAASPCVALVCTVAKLRAMARDSGAGAIDDAVDKALVLLPECPRSAIVAIICDHEGRWQRSVSILGPSQPMHAKGGAA